MTAAILDTGLPTGLSEYPYVGLSFRTAVLVGTIDSSTIDFRLKIGTSTIHQIITAGVFQSGYTGTIVANGSNGFDVTVLTHPELTAASWTPAAFADTIAGGESTIYTWAFTSITPGITTSSFNFVFWEDLASTDHESLGLARLIWQYRGDQPRLQSFLSAFLEELQGIEDVTLQVLSERWPLTAIGDQLDIIGKIVDQPRGELTDDEYRLFILARILVNRSNGTIPEILEILSILGIVDNIQIVEYFPCELLVSIVNAEHGDVIGDLIGETKAGGVTLHWHWSTVEDDEVFTYGPLGGVDEADVGRGYGSIGAILNPIGGQISGENIL